MPYTPIEDIIDDDSSSNNVIKHYGDGKNKYQLDIYPHEGVNITSTHGVVSTPYPILLKNIGFDKITIDSFEVVGPFTVVTMPEELEIDETIGLLVRANAPMAGTFTGGLYIHSTNLTGRRFIKFTNIAT